MRNNYRSSNTRIALLTINMLLFIMVIADPKDDTTLILALGFGGLNFLAMLDCLKQRSRDESNNNS
jgi:hypothetical protein